MRWKELRLGQVLESIAGGGTPSRDVPEFFDGDIPWASIKDLTGFELRETKERITDQAVSASSARRIPPGHVILATRIAPGKVAVNRIELAINQDLKALRPDPSLITPEFLAYFLRANSRRIEQQSVGSTVKGVSIEQILKWLVPLPTLPEQYQIVDLLGRADRLHALHREADAVERGLVHSLFASMFGDADPSAELPEGWSVEPLEQLLEETQYGLPDSLFEAGDVPVLRMNNITPAGGLDLSDLKFADREGVDWSQYELKPGDILFNRTNSLDQIGKVGLWREERGSGYSFASYLIRLRTNGKATPEFLWALLSSPYGRTRMLRLAKHAVSMANINVSELGSIPVVVPPMDLQDEFSRRCEAVFASSRERARVGAELRRLLDSLSAYAFVGRLTSAWREENHDLLKRAERERDNALARKSDRTLEVAPESPADVEDPRALVLAMLGASQRNLLRWMNETGGYVVEDILADVAAELENHAFTPAVIRQDLVVLEQLGLIQQVSRLSATTGRFVPAHRAVRSDRDHANIADDLSRIGGMHP